MRESRQSWCGAGQRGGIHRAQANAHPRGSAARVQRRRDQHSGPLVAQLEARGCLPLHATFRLAHKIDVARDDPPRCAQLPVDHDDIGITDAHAPELTVARDAVPVPVRLRRIGELPHQRREGRRLGRGLRVGFLRRLSALVRLRQTAQIDRDRSVGTAKHPQAGTFDFNRARPDVAEQQGAERKRDLCARHAQNWDARRVGRCDVQQANVEGPIDPHAESFPGECGRAHLQPRRAVVSVDRIFDPMREPGQIHRPLRKPPGRPRAADASQNRQKQREGRKPVQDDNKPARRLTRQSAHGQPAAV